jgi:DNA-binding response OmpR family regulator
MAQQVLVIDDHPTIAELLAIHLTSGFEIDDAANSEQMHTRLQNKKYDVAVLDLELKDGHNGLEHIVKLQESGTRVLIYSRWHYVGSYKKRKPNATLNRQ